MMGNNPGLDKIPTGIAGIDEITGGLPQGRTTLVLGGPGAGKTVFALQTLANQARRFGAATVFVAFEECSEQLLSNAARFGWGLPALIERNKAFFLDAHLAPDVVQTGRFDLAGLLAIVEAKARSMECHQVVFDGLDALLALIDDPAAERKELYRIQRWLAGNGLTAMLTSKSEAVEPSTPQRYSYLPFMADCVVLLQQRMADRIQSRWIRILKYRGSSFLANDFPLVISASGLEVPVRAAMERRSRELELARAERFGRLEAIRREMAIHEAELVALAHEREEFEGRWATQ